MARGRVRGDRPLGRWAGVVLADPGRPGRDWAALHPGPARCRPAGAHPGSTGSPPVPGSQPAYRDGHAWWRPERRIRAAIGGRATSHVPDAEVSWPDLPESAYPGECWAIEAELTPKPLARTAAIMAGLLNRTADYYPDSAPAGHPRYTRVVYLAAPAARGVTGRAAASLPPLLAARMTVRDLPPGASA